MYALDVRRLVDTLGGALRVSRELRESGLARAAPIAVIRWVERNSIPSHRLADLLILAKGQNKKINLYKFIHPMSELNQHRAPENAA